MCEPTWWQMASPAWLFRAKPAEYEYSHGICGLIFVEGYFSLLAYHVVFVGIPVAFWIQVGWHPWIVCLTTPALAVSAVLFSADIKFRLQRTTAGQRMGFDLAAAGWFASVFWPMLLASTVVAGAGGLVWWVVSLFV